MSISAHVPSGAGRLPGLDSLRGLAVVAVLTYHLRYLSGGFLGVDVFFVLSGFLVTGLAIDEVRATGRLGLRAFWGRRVRRLVPALLVVVPVVVAAALASSWPTVERAALAWDSIATLSWWANWRQLVVPGGYWSEVPSLFRHAWSLSIEEQFYVVWPLILTVVVALTGGRSRHRRRRLVVGLTAAALGGASAVWGLVLARRLDPSELSRIYLGSDTRAMAPLAGCLAATIWWGRRPGRLVQGAGLASAAVLGLLIATVAVDDPATYEHGILILVPVLAALAVAAASTLSRTDPVSRWLGMRSYAIYLWSWPIQILAEHRWPEASRTIVTVATVSLTLVISEVSWRLVELPAQGRSPVLDLTRWRRRFAGLATAGVAVAVFAAASTATERPAYQQLDDVKVLDAALSRATSDPDGDATGDPDGERVMIFGDSIAYSYGKVLPSRLPDGVKSVDNRGLPYCGVLSFSFDGPSSNKLCAKVPRILRTGLAARPDVVLWFPGGWEWGPPRDLGLVGIKGNSPELAERIEDRIVEVARLDDEAGARTVIVPLSCPGPDDMPERTNKAYLRWLDVTLRAAVDQAQQARLPVAYGPLPKGVCVGGVDGEPTDAKNAALGDEVHSAGTPEAAAWIWNEWLGPVVRSTR